GELGYWRNGVFGGYSFAPLHRSITPTLPCSTRRLGRPVMNDSELNQTLKSARVPERLAEYWEQFPKQILPRLRQGSVLAAPKRTRKPPLLIWTTGFATACLVIGFGIGFWHGRHQVSEGGSLTESVKLVREIAAL